MFEIINIFIIIMIIINIIIIYSELEMQQNIRQLENMANLLILNSKKMILGESLHSIYYIKTIQFNLRFVFLIICFHFLKILRTFLLHAMHIFQAWCWQAYSFSTTRQSSDSPYRETNRKFTF